LKIRGTFSIEEVDWSNLEDSAKKLGYKSRNELIQALTKKVLYGENVKSESTIKEQIEEAKLNLLLEKIKIAQQDFRIKEAFADFVQEYIIRFKKFPTAQGFRALMSRAENTTQPETTFKKTKEEWKPKFSVTVSCGLHMGFCKICMDSDFTALKEEILIEKLEDHIKEEHQEDPYTRILL